MVVNELGLHVRPAGNLVKLANRYKSKIILSKDGESVDAKSIMGVMMLGAEKGSTVHIEVDGDDAEEAANAIVELFTQGFGEMDDHQGKSGV